jgi:hypothetical protein
MNLKHNILALVVGKAKNQRKFPLTSLVFFLFLSPTKKREKKKEEEKKKKKKKKVGT